MLSKLWPLKLKTPHFELGTPFEEGLAALRRLGDVREETDGKEGHSARIDTSDFSVALYEKQGRVSAVWYDDPSGRLTAFDKRRKLRLYFQRYGKTGQWEPRINNDWMIFYFNDADNAAVVYGIHKDVIRINDRHDYEHATSSGAET